MTPKTFIWASVLIACAAISFAREPNAPHREAAHDVMCTDIPCFTLRARTDAILSHNGQLTAAHRYLVIGDSLTEYAVLESVCGAAPVNAGISGATTTAWLERARPLADTIKPDFVVVALGTNDGYLGRVEGYGARLDALIAALKPYPTIIIPPPPSTDLKYAARFAQLTAIAAARPNAATPLASAVTTDGVHLAPSDYVAWKAGLAAKAASAICPGRRP